MLLFILTSAPVLASNTFTVTVQSSSNYLIGGQPDPTLDLVRGETYIFDINAAVHPFYIKTIPGTGTGNAYSSGVTGNGTTVGSLTFTVPMDAPDTLYYNCSIHGGMTGAINISDPPIREYVWGENVGWLNAAPSGHAVTVHFDGTSGWLSGYAWGENIGWVAFPTNGNGGVNLNASGDLSGYAWGENIGWISFPTNGNGGVSIDMATGEFSGDAWGENIGWLRFKGSSPDYGVRTLAFDTQAQGTPNWWLADKGVSEVYDEGDGVPAWKEYITDTDPNNPSNFFQVISVTTTGTTAEVEVWPTSTRRYYTLTQTEDLTSDIWSNVTGQVSLPGQGGLQCLEDAGAGGQRARSYRVEVSVSP